MALECINPADLPIPSTYTHVVVATGSRWVFIAGQEPEDQEGSVAATVISRLRRGRSSQTSAVRSQPREPDPNR